MATIADLKVAFSADTKKLQDGIKNAGQTVKNSGKQIETAFGAKGTQAIGGTTNAVINFNRVIQDAPYGLIGVANNIDPLVQSFQGLRASAGSTGGALRLLLKSAFTGPGAMITVVSLATSGLLLLQKRMRGTGDAANEAKPDVETFNKVLEDQVKALLQLQNLKGPEGQLQIAREQLKVYDQVLADLKEQQRLLEEQSTKEEVQNTNAISQNRLRGSRAILLGLEGTQKTKDLEAQIESTSARREEILKNIESLERLIGTETYKNLKTQGQSLKTIQEYNDALLQAKTNIIEAGDALEDKILFNGLELMDAFDRIRESAEKLNKLYSTDFVAGTMMPPEDLDSIVASFEKMGQQLGDKLPVVLTQAQTFAKMFTESFAQGLAQVIAYGESLGDMLEGLARQILREGIYKILIALFTGGTGSALTTAGSFGSGLLSGIGGIFGSLGSPVSMGKLPPMMGKTEVYGRFEIKGSDLVTVLSNANTRTLR